MKKTTQFVTLCAILSISTTAYSTGKDESYYKANQDEAKEKYTECQKLIGELAAAGNIPEMMKIADDPECQAADRIVTVLDR